jgi:hypothetical protein
MNTRVVNGLFIVVCAIAVAQGEYANAANAAPSAAQCTTQQEPAFMTSWFGQTGVADHSESQPTTKGTYFACLAFAADLSVPPACVLSFRHNRKYTLLPHNGMRAPVDDVVTLSCQGKTPSCCKVQFDARAIRIRLSSPER